MPVQHETPEQKKAREALLAKMKDEQRAAEAKRAEEEANQRKEDEKAAAEAAKFEAAENAKPKTMNDTYFEIIGAHVNSLYTYVPIFSSTDPVDEKVINEAKSMFPQYLNAIHYLSLSTSVSDEEKLKLKGKVDSLYKTYTERFTPGKFQYGSRISEHLTSDIGNLVNWIEKHSTIKVKAAGSDSKPRASVPIPDDLPKIYLAILPETSKEDPTEALGPGKTYLTQNVPKENVPEKPIETSKKIITGPGKAQ